MKKVYLSGKWSQREEFQAHARMLWQHGYEVVSTWVNESGANAWEFGSWRDARIAMRDLNQIAMCDLFIIDTNAALSQDGGGGRETELGFALSQYQHVEIWRVGPIKNPFHALASRSFQDWSAVEHSLELPF